MFAISEHFLPNSTCLAYSGKRDKRLQQSGRKTEPNREQSRTEGCRRQGGTPVWEQVLLLLKYLGPQEKPRVIVNRLEMGKPGTVPAMFEN